LHSRARRERTIPPHFSQCIDSASRRDCAFTRRYRCAREFWELLLHSWTVRESAILFHFRQRIPGCRDGLFGTSRFGAAAREPRELLLRSRTGDNRPVIQYRGGIEHLSNCRRDVQGQRRGTYREQRQFVFYFHFFFQLRRRFVSPPYLRFISPLIRRLPQNPSTVAGESSPFFAHSLILMTQGGYLGQSVTPSRMTRSANDISAGHVHIDCVSR
jgi:hypothetical protein